MRTASDGRVVVMIGVNMKDGTGLIMPYLINPDMGDNGFVGTPVEFEHGGKKFKFSYMNKKTGNSIYREV